MRNPENDRALADERGAAQAEAQRSAEEQPLWQRASTVDTDPDEATVEGLLARLAAIEAAGYQSPDLGRARAVLEGALSADPALAQVERSQAISLRRAAVQAREQALRALTQAVEQAEAKRAAQQKDIGAIEGYLTKFERRGASSAPAAAPTQAAAKPVAAAAPTQAVAKPVAPAAPPPPAPPPKPLAAALSFPSAPPSVPGPAMPAPGFQPMPAASQAAPADKPELTVNTLRRLSKRRRVRVAPPPKKLEVEVAVYGENNFYTGFDNKIASGGLFVASLETLPAGHELDLIIDLEGKEIRTRGRVEFPRVDNNANPECTPGAGIKLLNLPPDAVKAVEAFFQERPPIFMAPAH
jgi:hypothetical protein